MSVINVLLVGDIGCPEFHPALPVLHACAVLQIADSAEAAGRLLSTGQYVADLLVLAQSYPGQWSAEAVERLRRLAPMAPVVGLLGSWCEGEERSGRPWPGAIRCYWHQWPARAARQLQDMGQGRPAAWALPATAIEEDRLLVDLQPDRVDTPGFLVISSGNSAVGEMLCDACTERGWSTVLLGPDWNVPISKAAAGLFDSPDMTTPQCARLRRLCDLIAPAPVLALLDFPRIEDALCALRIGAAAVLSKPVQLRDLFWQLEHLIAQDAPLHKKANRQG